MRRLMSRIGKALSYFWMAVEHPRQALTIFGLLLTERSYLREWLRLAEAAWLRDAGVRTVIDVGAYKGSFSYGALKALPEAQVYAFEPLPEHFARLDRLAKNGRLKAFNVALGNAQGETRFHRNEFSASSSVLPMSDTHRAAFPETVRSDEVTVKLGRLDDYAGEMELRDMTLLKVDVQGYDFEVLKGAENTLKRVDFVLVEISLAPLYEGQANFDEIYEFLGERGFAYAGDFDQLRSRQDVRVLQVDGLFVRRAD
ncbi:MAG: FkbM family methyltransferase [Chloroflexi bacterium]|nr:FkbM family methyltransferase [Chloroflexota bacterium]